MSVVIHIGRQPASCVLATVLVAALGSCPGAAALGQDNHLAPPASAREILARYDIGTQQLEQFKTDGPLEGAQEELLAKILFHFPRLGLDNIHRWRRDNADWDKVARTMDEQRGELFAIHGRATLVTEHQLPQPLARRFDMPQYYSVTLDIADSPRVALVHTTTVPRAWPRGVPIDQPAAADGLLLKSGPSGADRGQLVFAAGRVAWLPDRVDWSAGIAASHVALAGRGLDIGLFDAARDNNGSGLLAADREPFYQLLSALSRGKPDELSGVSESIDVAHLLQHPQECHGRVFRVRGTVRRIVKVAIDDVRLSERVGLDHYFEIDLFAPLGDARLVFDQKNQDGSNPVFESTFPVTLVALQLPPGLAEGEDLHEQVEADAVFFKLWSYRSAFMTSFDRRQPAPLMMTREPRLAPAGPQDNWVVTVLVVSVFGLAVTVVGVLFWWNRTERVRRRYRVIL